MSGLRPSIRPGSRCSARSCWGNSPRRYALLLIVDGSGFYQDDETGRRRIGPGDLIILRPEIACARGPDSSWREYWLSAGGPLMGYWVDQLLPRQPIVHLEDPSVLVGGFRDLITRARDRLLGWQLEVELAIHRLLMDVHRQIASSRSGRSGLHGMEEFLHRHLDRSDCDLPGWCRRQRLSYQVLRRRFQREFGCPPHRHLLRLKLTHAASLLATDPQRPVAGIAAAVGMEPAYFSRVFRRHFGMNPRTYRQQAG